MRRMIFVVFAVSILAMLAGCASQPLGAGPQVEAARLAVADAQDQGADKWCPQEFQSAELKLKQAELLLADEEDDEAGIVAGQTVNLADLAKKCAETAKVHGGEAPNVHGAPDELKNFKAVIYFDYNSNKINAESRAELDKAIAFLKGMAKEHKFYVLISAFCDPPGTVEDNTALAGRRALVARYYLSKNGISRSKVYMQALGKTPATRAIGANASRKAIPEWRKVEITVLFKRPTNVLLNSALD
ncbi:MAG: OmpA family protein [Candidatus Lernaella stagnicola]|nr:OmpA family protein [Candidatus Lernaella stagnicola]